MTGLSGIRVSLHTVFPARTSGPLHRSASRLTTHPLRIGRKLCRKLNTLIRRQRAAEIRMGVMKLPDGTAGGSY